jgi:hypothetical protein
MIQRALLAFGLGVLVTLAVAWALPWAMMVSVGGTWGIFDWNPAVSGPNYFWRDSGPPYAHAGFHSLNQHPLLDIASMVRADYQDCLEKRDRSNRVPPPPWAAVVSEDGREGYSTVITTHSGWPLRCFRGEVWTRWCLPFPSTPGMSLLYSSGQFHAQSSWPVEALGGTFMGVPNQVLWRGALLNVMLYAAAWFAVLSGVRTAHRALRHRRGLCPNCGYSRESLGRGACPECGTCPKHAAPA